MHVLSAIAVPAVPVISEAVLGIATLAAVLVCIVCLGLREGWDHTIGYGLRWVANQIEDVGVDVGGWLSVHPFGFVADVFRSVDHHVSHALAVAALNSEKAVAWLWHMTGRLFWWSVHETKHLAIDTWHSLEHFAVTTIPDAAKWARREAVEVARRITHEEAALRRAADARIGHLAHVAEADALHGIRAAEHALDWSEAQVGALGRDLTGLKARVEALAHRLSPAALVALIGATIFTEFGLGWLRCHNVGRAGKRLCGLGVDAIDALLLGTLAVEGAVSLVGITNELVDLADEIVPTVTGFFSELGAVPLRTAREQGLV